MLVLPFTAVLIGIVQPPAIPAVQGSPLVVYAAPAEEAKALQIVRVKTRAASRPATRGAVAATKPTTNPYGATVQPDAVDIYEVWLVHDNKPKQVVWSFERNRYAGESSKALRYRILAAAILGDYLFLVEKSSLSTSAMNVRLDPTRNGGRAAGWQLLLTDNHADGPRVVSAAILPAATWEDSKIVLNPDQPSKAQREFVLAQLFKLTETGSGTAQSPPTSGDE
jgi:hypothetical protein